MRPRQAAAEHGEVLGEDEHQPPVHRAAASDHAVAGDAGVGHAEVHRPVLDEHVGFLERTLVQQQGDALARRQLALGMLGGDAPLAAAGPGVGAAALEFLDDMLHAQGPP